MHLQFDVTRKFLELLICCFDGQLVQNLPIFWFFDEEVVFIVFADDWGIKKTSDGPFINIKPMDPWHPRGIELFRRQFFYILSSSASASSLQNENHPVPRPWISLIRLHISMKPQEQIAFSGSIVRRSFSLTRGVNLAFLVIMRNDRSRRISNVFIRFWDQGTLSCCKFPSFLLLNWSFFVACTFQGELSLSPNASRTGQGRGGVQFLID